MTILLPCKIVIYWLFFVIFWQYPTAPQERQVLLLLLHCLFLFVRLFCVQSYSMQQMNIVLCRLEILFTFTSFPY